jgi:endonuclease/exonuclease/phosphatase family metal-dependent hydrolase
MRTVWTGLLSAALAAGAACEGTEKPTITDAGQPPLCERVDELDALAAEESYDYTWTCSGEVAPAGKALPDDPLASDCAAGIWPELDDTVDVCPTVSSETRTDPVSGRELPSPDSRSLPTEIPVTEAGSFLLPNLPASWPSTLRVVAWNVEYTAHLDQQIAALTSTPELASADVFLLSEVDRCSERNGLRRAARELAQALDAAYVYGIEFVELEIGRSLGGDTGQAILSRRPLTSAALSCHSSQHDWLASTDEPRLGQRVFLHADVPVGDQSVRLYAVHLESNDLFGDKRSAQAKELLDAAQQLACDRPQIVGGDFNAPYCGAPELQIFRDAGFVDALAVAGDLGTTHGATRLDYVWSRGLRVVAGGVIRDLGASDHDALWVELELE